MSRGKEVKELREIIVIICNCKSDLVEERGTEYN